MEKDKILIIAMFVLVVGVLIYSISGFIPQKGEIPQQKKVNSVQPVTAGTFRSMTTGTTDPGEVSIELTPHEIKNGKLEVDISANTHSVDLSKFNLKQITTLEYNGKSINPIEAPSLDGHHASGTLVFELGDSPKSFSIIIKGIPKEEERIFVW